MLRNLDRFFNGIEVFGQSSIKGGAGAAHKTSASASSPKASHKEKSEKAERSERSETGAQMKEGRSKEPKSVCFYPSGNITRYFYAHFILRFYV